MNKTQILAQIITGLIPVYAPVVTAVVEKYAGRLPYVGAVGLGVIGTVLADQIAQTLTGGAGLGPAWAAAAGAGAEAVRQFWQRVSAALPKK